MSPAWSYILAALSGAAIMVAELGAARMLTPVFGSSIGVWAIVIAITMVGLAVGYAIGGRWADRAGGVVVARRAALLGAMYIALLPLIRGPLLRSTADLPTELGSFVAASVLLLPCLVFLGQVSPALIRGLTGSDGSHVGGTAGGVYAVSTLGSLVGTLLAGLWLLPYLPVGITFPATSAVLLLPMLAGARLLAMSGLALAGTSMALSLPSSGAFGVDSPSDHPCELAHVRQSRFGELRVVDCLPGVRLLLTNGMEQGAISMFTGVPPYPYAEFFLAAARRHIERPRNGLIVGVGAGVMVKPLRALGQDLDLVEIDPEVVAVAREYFSFDAPVQIDDGRRFLGRTEKRWDVIYVDAVLGGNPPWHLFTREAFELYRSRLTEAGAVVVNFVGNHYDPDQRPALESLVATARRVFPEVAVYASPGYSPDSAVLNYALVGTRLPARPAGEVDDYESWQVARLAGEIDTVELGNGRVLRDAAAPLAPLMVSTMGHARRVARTRFPLELLID